MPTKMTKIICVFGSNTSENNAAIKSFKDFLNAQRFDGVKDLDCERAYKVWSSTHVDEEPSQTRDPKDIFEVFEGQKDGCTQRIGIVSVGSYPEDWTYVFLLIFFSHCDVVICAAHEEEQPLCLAISEMAGNSSACVSLSEVDAEELDRDKEKIFSSGFAQKNRKPMPTKMTKIICVRGLKGSRKSTAIKSFRGYLEKQGFVVKKVDDPDFESACEAWSRTHASKEPSRKKRGRRRGRRPKDIFEIFRIEKDGCSQKIGIVSEGDYSADWAYVFVLIFFSCCDVVVCAARGGEQPLYKAIVNTEKRFSDRVSLEKVDTEECGRDKDKIVQDIFNKMMKPCATTLKKN